MPTESAAVLKTRLSATDTALQKCESDNVSLRKQIENLQAMLNNALIALARSAPEAATNPNQPLVRLSDDGFGTAPRSEESKLHRLTLKQCAVVVAVIEGVGFHELASLLDVSDTTIKMHLRAAMKNLDERNRNELAANWKPLIAGIEDDEFERRYGIAKNWFSKPKKQIPPGLLEKRSSLAPEALKKSRVRSSRR